MKPILLAIVTTIFIQPITLIPLRKSKIRALAPTGDEMTHPCNAPRIYKKKTNKLTGPIVWSDVFGLNVPAAPKDRIGLAVHKNASITSEVDVRRDLIFLSPFGLLQLTNIDRGTHRIPTGHVSNSFSSLDHLQRGSCRRKQ